MNCSKRELLKEWTLDEVIEAHNVLDSRDDARARIHARMKREQNNG